MYCMLTYGDKDRAIPFELVTKNNEFHSLFKSISYPSEFGMSRPFMVSEYNKDCERYKVSWKQVVTWVESRALFIDTVMAAHRGDVRARETLREWDEVKRNHR